MTENWNVDHWRAIWESFSVEQVEAQLSLTVEGLDHAVRGLGDSPSWERLGSYRLAARELETARAGARVWTDAHLSGLEKLTEDPREPSSGLTEWEAALHAALQGERAPDPGELGEDGVARMADVIGRAFTRRDGWAD